MRNAKDVFEELEEKRSNFNYREDREKRKELTSQIHSLFDTFEEGLPDYIPVMFDVNECMNEFVEIEGGMVDHSFDYEYGSISGTHDPGSTFEFAGAEVNLDSPEDFAFAFGVLRVEDSLRKAIIEEDGEWGYETTIEVAGKRAPRDKDITVPVSVEGWEIKEVTFEFEDEELRAFIVYGSF